VVYDAYTAYRTLDNMIEGAVLTFMDVTEEKKKGEALYNALEDIRTLRGLIPICASCKKSVMTKDSGTRWKRISATVPRLNSATASVRSA